MIDHLHPRATGRLYLGDRCGNRNKEIKLMYRKRGRRFGAGTFFSSRGKPTLQAAGPAPRAVVIYGIDLEAFGP